MKADVEAEQVARQSLGISAVQYRAGSTTYVTVLNAEQTLLNTSTNRVKAQAARFSDTVALFQSLGGGWWNRVDETPAADPKPTDATALSPLAAALADPNGPAVRADHDGVIQRQEMTNSQVTSGMTEVVLLGVEER